MHDSSLSVVSQGYAVSSCVLTLFLVSTLQHVLCLNIWNQSCKSEKPSMIRNYSNWSKLRRPLKSEINGRPWDPMKTECVLQHTILLWSREIGKHSFLLSKFKAVISKISFLVYLATPVVTGNATNGPWAATCQAAK